MKFTDVAGIMNIPYVAEKVKLSHVAEIVKLSHVAGILEAGSMYDRTTEPFCEYPAKKSPRTILNMETSDKKSTM